MELITDIEQLKSAAEPLEFLTEKGVEKEEGEEIIGKLKAFLENDRTAVAVTAPQLGINKRIFCMRFKDSVKTFINPVITKKSNYNIQPETCSSMPGKEILICRPDEITVVYYTDGFQYEENKLLGIAARVFDQNAQLLDGVTPDVMGVVTDIDEDGSLWDASEEEMAQLVDMYKKIMAARSAEMQKAIGADESLSKQYQNLRFTEKVINGEANVVGKSPSVKAQAKAALAIRAADQSQKLAQRAQRMRFVNKKRK